MSIWEELADLKRRIPKDTQVYHVIVRYDNILCEHRVHFHLTDYSYDILGLIDAPMCCRSTYGYYTTKEKAIQAVKDWSRNFTYPVKYL